MNQKNQTIRHGMKPRAYKDHRNYSFGGTFGVAALRFLGIEIDYDAHLGIPDQNADGLPLGCTGYTTKEVAMDYDAAKGSDADKKALPYKAKFTYEKTCMMENHPDTEGCNIENALKSATIYGLQGENETTDDEALTHRRGQRFEIERTNGYDWFDTLRSALVLNPYRSISLGTPWFLEWEAVGSDGILTSQFVYNGNPEDYNWHNSKIDGIVFHNNEWMLKDKSWQGANKGDGGWVYFDRETINKVMAIQPQCAAYTQAKAYPEDIETIQVTLWEALYSYCVMWISILRKKAQ